MARKSSISLALTFCAAGLCAPCASWAAEAEAHGAEHVTTVDYDPAVTHAQVAGMAVIDYGGRAAAQIEQLWDAVRDALAASRQGKVLDE